MKKPIINVFIMLICLCLIASCNKEQSSNDKIFTVSGHIWKPTYNELKIFYEDGYNIIDGNVTITGIDSIVDLSLLSNVEKITGFLYIHSNENLLTLQGIYNLKSVLGISVGPRDYHGMSNIANLNGLNPDLEIKTHLFITENPKLTSLNGLSGLKSISFHCIIYDNDLLTSLSGLENITSIDRELDIIYNDSLSDFCAIEVGMMNIKENYLFNTQHNKFNPSAEDIIAGNCSQ